MSIEVDVQAVMEAVTRLCVQEARRADPVYLPVLGEIERAAKLAVIEGVIAALTAMPWSFDLALPLYKYEAEAKRLRGETG